MTSQESILTSESTTRSQSTIIKTGWVHDAFSSSEDYHVPQRKQRVVSITVGVTGAGIGLGVVLFLVSRRYRQRWQKRSVSQPIKPLGGSGVAAKTVSRPYGVRNTLGI